MLWQKFTETVLREDGARFAVETPGSAPLAAWVYSAAQMVKYHHLVLACEWEERTAGRRADGWCRPWPAPGQTLADYARERAAAFRRHAAPPARAERQESDLQAFLEQLSIQRILDPQPHLDRRVPVPEADLKIAVILDGCYYLLPASGEVPAFEGGEPTQVDLALAGAPRGRQARLRRLLPAATRAEIAALRQAPILINWDLHDGARPLGEIRRTARRGCNDHPLVLIRTTTGMVFDFSHVMYDAIWAIQLAELMTRLAQHAPVQGAPSGLASPLRLEGGPDFAAAAAAQRNLPEAAAETTAIALPPLLELRRQTGCSVNDLLLLARWRYSEHCGERPPALLIPVDMSGHAPRERLRLAVARPSLYTGDLRRFSQSLKELYAETVADRTFAARAQQVMVMTPPPFRALGNWGTEQVPWVNDRIKGREVFSNVGAVPPGGSATRFVSARGMGGVHDRVWGVLTTASGELYVSVRDFRPGADARHAREYLEGLAQFTNRLVEAMLNPPSQP